ncbi:MAG: hypothetical protein CSA79_03185 [Thiothrix nivea]|nr:MAG: hypothetical protein CSA79_03185 [Thiothrix nivea]
MATEVSVATVNTSTAGTRTTVMPTEVSVATVNTSTTRTGTTVMPTEAMMVARSGVMVIALFSPVMTGYCFTAIIAMTVNAGVVSIRWSATGCIIGAAVIRSFTAGCTL